MNIDYTFFAPENWNLIFTYVLKGLGFSLLLTVVATIGGIFLGTIIALMRLSNSKVLQWTAAIYVDGLRSMPLMLVLLGFFLVVPFLLGHPLAAETCAIITFVLFEATYFSEIVRAGIRSVSSGQSQAGQALGMTYGQNMRLIVLPQAFRNMIPVFLTQVIVLFQDTSLVYVIGAYDLLKGFSVLSSNTSRPVEAYLLAAVVYFIICFSLSRAVKAYQKRVAIIR
ncbi:amino acid ABC transporter permease [Saezia sanguinis]|uniref:amino acid ABC transporter permease n=1 Tax=Saezia sanguinis TaxID=1965230 RepID=UPI00302F0598